MCCSNMLFNIYYIIYFLLPNEHCLIEIGDNCRQIIKGANIGQQVHVYI